MAAGRMAAPGGVAGIHAMPRHEFPVLNEQFLVDVNYDFVKELGQGAYGVVCAAKHRVTGDAVAIKKVTKIFTKRILTKRALRELKLLHHFRNHKNITCLYDMDVVDPLFFDSVYLYEELMEADLHAIIRSGQPLSDQHYQSFIYQTLCGLHYIHSANVLHRDLKPGNLLVNADCELKICDFGLARGLDINPDSNIGFMTEYVATRWYRAPEIMLSFANYTTAIDTWSVGCILAELLGGRPFFKGKDYIDQLNIVLHFLGTPSDETLARVGSPRAQDYIRSLPFKPGVPFTDLFPRSNPLALDLLARLLSFDPSTRITCAEALRHPYLSVWYDAADEVRCERTFDFAFEKEDSTEGMRRLIVEEVEQFRRMVRPPPLGTAGTPAAAAAVPAAIRSGPGAQSDGAGSLPVPTRDEIMSPMGPGGNVAGGAAPQQGGHMDMQVDDRHAQQDYDLVPADELERELKFGAAMVAEPHSI